MKVGAEESLGSQLKALREAAGFTQDELATIAGLSVHAVSALERGERRRPHVETVRALSAALDLNGATRDGLLASARAPAREATVDELSPASLPLSPTALLGRDGDVRMLRQWLADPAARVITLIGPGGVGKTRLALEIARLISDEGSTRVLFVSLAAICDPAFVAPAIAEALALSDVAPGDLPRRAAAACGDHPTLMVLDNCEHVLDAAPLVADVVRSAASLRLIATSRAPLRVRGEREYAVGPLALWADPTGMSPADLVRSPAVRLFVERARDVQPAFCLTSANGPTVSAICRRLDALPLAIELAAPWIKVLTADDLLHRLEHDVLPSCVGPRDLPQRQQTMNATVAWSYQLLAPAEKTFFRRVSALQGGFPIDAAAAVLAADRPVSHDEALNAAASLMDKSLLVRAETSAPRPLYQMLETVRAYAALELTAAGERDDVLEALARYCRAEAALADVGLVGPAQAGWLDRVRANLDSYRGALTWLIDLGRATEACDIACGLKFYWLIRGRAAEGLAWYERILALRSLPPRTESRTLAAAAMMSYTQGDLERGGAGLTRALPLARAAGDLETVAQADNLLGHIERALGNLDGARVRFGRSVDAFQALGIPWGTGSALNGLAGVALATGDETEGQRLLDLAASVLREAGPWFLMPVLYLRAIRVVRRGDADTAIALIRETLGRIQDLHDKFAFVYALVPLAAAAVLKGDHAWAARILGARDGVVERTGLSVVDTPVHDLRERAEREARSHLGPSRWTQAYTAGRRASIDSARDLCRFVADNGR